MTQLVAKPAQEVMDSLNELQLRSATSPSKRKLTVAGPGTGKTHMMNAEVRYLIDQGVDPYRLVVLSFTNESANESESRIASTSGEQGLMVNCSTFHSWCNRILRRYRGHPFFKEKLGYPEGFFIIDTDEQRKLYNEAKKTLDPAIIPLIEKGPFDWRTFSGVIGRHRANCMNPSLFVRKVLGDHSKELLNAWQDLKANLIRYDPNDAWGVFEREVSATPQLHDLLVAEMWNHYQQACKRVNAIDFDDVLLNTLFLLKANADVCGSIAKHIDHILVDEYQDTNVIQAQFLRLLLKANPNIGLSLVGDPRQSIYAFRAGDVRLMTHADKYFGKFEIHELETNYRSSANIVQFNNVFAKMMHDQITDGQLESGHGIADPSKTKEGVFWHHFPDDQLETTYITEAIRSELKSGVPAEEIYVLYRTRAVAKKLESTLTLAGIPYQMVGEINFFERAEVRDALGLLRTFCRPRDVLAWSRITDCTSIPVTGIWLRKQHKEFGREKLPVELIKERATGKTASAINGFMEMHNQCQVLMSDPASLSEFHETMYPNENFHELVLALENTPELKQQYQDWRRGAIAETISLIGQWWIEEVSMGYAKTDIKTAEKKEGEVSAAELTNERVERLISLFNEVTDRLIGGNSLTEIVDDLMTRDSPRRDEAKGCIKMMTGHASKGLQASTVFFLGCEEKVWYPESSEVVSETELYEPERVYFVMSTRAKSKLVYTSSEQRFINGSTVRSAPLSLLLNHVNALEEQGLGHLMKKVDHTRAKQQVHSNLNQMASTDEADTSMRSKLKSSNLAQLLKKNREVTTNKNTNGHDLDDSMTLMRP